MSDHKKAPGWRPEGNAKTERTGSLYEKGYNDTGVVGKDLCKLGLRLSPCTERKKLRKGWNNETATSDFEKLRRFEGDNFHIWSGRIEGSDLLWGCLDFDVKDGKKGYETYLCIVALNGPPPEDLWNVRTPSGGFHIEGYQKKYHRWKFVDVDVYTRNDTGHWMAPGSKTPNGTYTLTSGDIESPGYLDDWIVHDDITRVATTRARMKADGNFHDNMRTFAQTLAGWELSREEIVPRLHALYQLRCIDEPNMRSLQRKELEDAAAWAVDHPFKTINDALPKVWVSGLIAEKAGNAWAALEEANTPPAVFSFASELHRVDGEGQIDRLIPPRFTHMLNRMVQFITPTQKGPVRIDCPGEIVRDMIAAPHYPVPPLRRVVKNPVFNPEGRLIGEPGYDPSGVFLHDAEGLPTIRPMALEEAKGLIDEWLIDFPFESQSDKTNTVALLLTPIVRDMIAGQTPLYLVESSTPGTGKGLVVETGFRITGTEYALMTQPEDSDESRKRITAVLRETGDAVLIDNLAEGIDSAELAAVLTSEWWTDRVLGKSETVRLPNRKVWVATGNNPALSLEIARRTVRIRMVPDVENPWNKTGFKHPNLHQWVADNRETLLSASISVVQSWVAAGKHPGSEQMGSYNEFARVLGGILKHAGWEGFLGNKAKLFDTTVAEHQRWHFLCASWKKHFGTDAVVRAGDLLPYAEAIDGFTFNSRTDNGKIKALGRMLRKAEDGIYDGWQIVRAGAVQGTTVFQLREVNTTHNADPVVLESDPGPTMVHESLEKWGWWVAQEGWG